MPHRRLGQYLLACAIVAAATLLRQVVDPLVHDQIPYFIYVASVVVATWFCGVEGGILSTVVAAFAGNYFFVSPRYEFIPHGEDWIAMSLFTPVALGLVWLVGRWKRAERELQAQADTLRAQAEELRALNAEAERVNRVKDEFLATLSHELRTPLNAILGWGHMLEAGQLAPDRERDAVRTIVRNAHAQTRIVNDVLDVSRIVSGKMQLDLATVDLACVVAAALDAVRPAAEAKSIDVQMTCAPRSVIVGDPDRLQQMAWNLLSNAVKFTPRHGHVDVRVEAKESQVVLRVADSGIGIAPEFMPHLFERFRQADGSTTRRHGGLGLGLAIVRHLAELHGGTVSAESPGRNHGATFTVTFPVRAIIPAGGEAPPRTPGGPADDDVVTAAPALHGIRVLVVDDEQDAREMVQSALIAFGASVRAVASADEARQVLRIWRPDVLVADIGMPDEDGYSLISSVRALAPADGGAIPAAALTAYAQDDDRTRALAAGYQEHVAKPVAPQELAVVVANLAGRGASSPGVRS